jgi:saccharopine dehydrogenase (NAD+, L-lysine-forming)
MSLSIGLIHEGKIPSDSRVALTPKQCRFLKDHLSLEILVQHSPTRCYSDEEYLEFDIPVVEDVSAADILIGIKEVPVDQLIADKTYLFFSHTIKKQAHNRKLLKRMLEQKIRLIDYEVVVDDQGERLIAFGYYAGIVGAHNGMFAYANRNSLVLRRMHEFQHYEDIKAYYQTLNWPAIKVVVTGTGRVASGAVQVLLDMGLQQVSPQEYLSQQYNHPVFTQLGCKDYVARINDGGYDKMEFYASPELYHSTFGPYAEASDVFINGIYWGPQVAGFFHC